VVTVRPDLVLLDVLMPGIDGYTVCARIRADASLAAVRVIIVTANYGSADVQAARRAGADDFLWSSPSTPPRSSTWPRPCSARASDTLT
jgi:putative two-component system response regulator